MKTKKPWTTDEELVLLKEIKKHPENLDYCFFLTAKKVRRTPKACQLHWYNSLRHKTTEPVYAIVSQKKVIKNTKVDNKGKQVHKESGLSLWSAIKNLFG